MKASESAICKNCGEDIYYGISSSPAMITLGLDDSIEWHHKRTGTKTCRIMIAEPEEQR